MDFQLKTKKLLRVFRISTVTVGHGRLASFLIASLIALSSMLGQTNDSAYEEGEEIYARIYSGWKWFHVYCYRCHGFDALGSTLAPNLRESIKVLSYAEFLDLVKEGRAERGMQSWKELLDDKQITDIFYYVHARSDKVLPSGRPDEVGEGGGEWTPPGEWVEAMKSVNLSTKMDKESNAEKKVKPKFEDS